MDRQTHTKKKQYYEKNDNDGMKKEWKFEGTEVELSELEKSPNWKIYREEGKWQQAGHAGNTTTDGERNTLGWEGLDKM